MPKPKRKRFVPVIATAPDGTETRYPSVNAAAAAVGVHPGNITQACVMGHMRRGFHWRKEADDE